MYRKPGSNMTAVEVVSATYDGPIPHDVLMEARAEDAAYNADPLRAEVEAAIEGVRWNTNCARKTIAKIRELLASGDIRNAEYERDWTLCIHLKARRDYQAQARRIVQGAA